MTDETIFTIYIHSYILKLCVRKMIHSKFKREFDALFKKSWQAILGVKRSRILAIQILKVLNNKNPKYILMKEVFKRKVNSKFRLSIIAGKHFKVGLTFQSNFFICFNESPLKIMKNVFYFILTPHFVCDFSRKMFLMLYCMDWPNFIVWLPLLLEILCNMCIAIFSFQVYDVIEFENSIIFWIKLFFYMTKNSRKELNILRTIKGFKVTLKAFFIIFRGLLVAKYCLRRESVPLNFLDIVVKA